MTESARNQNDRLFGEAPVSTDRRQFLGYTAAGMLAFLLPGCSSGANSPYGRTVAAGQKAIQAALDGNTQNLATISVALLKGDRIVWQQAFGQASVQAGTPATTATRFNIGSVSKVIAALAATILQDRGLLNLDTPIAQYLKTFTMLSPEYTQVTTRHLLSHSSGFSGTNGNKIFTFEPVPGYAQATLAMLANQHLKHRPGEMAVYCNDGFTIVELVVEAVSGQSFASFVEQNILVPLDMTHSGYLTSAQTSGDFAYPYQKGTTYGLEYTNAYGSGGLSTTPADMMNLARMFIGQGMFNGKRIVSAAGIADMGTDQTTTLTLNPPPVWQWGLGWDTVAHTAIGSAGVGAWEKSGGTAFFQTEFFVLPHAQMALLITGSAGYKPLAIAETILLNALAEDGTIGAVPPLVSMTKPPAAPPPDVAAALGSYGNHDNPVQVKSNADGTLALNKWSGSAWIPLHDGATSYQYCSDGWWWSAGNTQFSYRFEVTPDTGSADAPYRYLVERNARFGTGYVYLTMPLAQQLPDRQPLDTAWLTRLKTPSWTITNLTSVDVAAALNVGPTQLSLSQIPELPGYILFDNQPLAPLADDRGGMMLKIPINLSRDLYEINFTTVNGTETITAGGYTLAPA